GDSAAGAIKSGGTTRRAAKMVCLDADHPDIFEFVNWKVTEENKVAALVAGSKAMEINLNKIVKAYHNEEIPERDRANPRVNVALKEALRAAKDAHIPMSMIARVIDLAGQGYTDLKLE